MISVIHTEAGTYNLLGTSEDEFTLQGNLTFAELIELKDQLLARIREAYGRGEVPV